ncbi:MAG: lysine exporter LysO family protein [Sphaerochaeta sp.]|nr:lysine exporter LysO family protein [Sphaerochaeta sp.]
MDTFLYLGKLAAALIVGMLAAQLFGRKRFVKQTALTQTFLVYLLLFFMGVNTGSIDGIVAQFGTIGLSAFLLTLISVLGTVVLSFGVSLLIGKDKRPLEVAIAPRKEQSLIRRIYDIVKEPLFLVGIVFFGLVLRLTTPFFSWYQSSWVSYLLYAMLFCVGMGLVQKQISFKGVFTDTGILLLPLYTILGSYLGVLLTPLLTPYTIKEGMGMVSGFGWYSLSGIMISDLGFPILGSISFLTNLLRESFSFFLVPFFGRLGNRFYAPAVCTSGATSMDVTLVLLSSHFGTRTIISSIYHGVVMSLIAPLLIPLFF